MRNRGQRAGQPGPRRVRGPHPAGRPNGPCHDLRLVARLSPRSPPRGQKKDCDESQARRACDVTEKKPLLITGEQQRDPKRDTEACPNAASNREQSYASTIHVITDSYRIDAAYSKGTPTAVPNYCRGRELTPALAPPPVLTGDEDTFKAYLSSGPDTGRPSLFRRSREEWPLVPR